MKNTQEIKTLGEKEFTRFSYEIELLHGGTYLVHADCAQDAIDELIDSWEETEAENPGFFLSAEEVEELREESATGADILSEVVSGGNHGRYTSFSYSDMRLEKIDTR